MNPAVFLLLLFVGVPLIELYFLIEVGSAIGAFPTIVLSILTAIIGGALVRMQGFSTAMRMRSGMERGEVPALEMLEGVVLLLSGILLLLPGFITDLIGFVALVPAIRQRVLIWLLQRSGTLQAGGSSDAAADGGKPRVIEGEYKRHDD